MFKKIMRFRMISSIYICCLSEKYFIKNPECYSLICKTKEVDLNHA